jgi:hypothetical protein
MRDPMISISGKWLIQAKETVSFPEVEIILNYCGWSRMDDGRSSKT